MQLRSKTPILLFLLCLGCVNTPDRGDDLLRLRIGDTARKDKQVSVGLDAVVDTARAEVIAPQMLLEQLRGHRLVMIGEQHTDSEHHSVQLRVIQLLQAAGVPLLIGMEMFPADSQPALDRWIDGALTESDFLAESEWYRVWGYHWGYYREILEFARMHGIRVTGLNASAATARRSNEQTNVEADLESDDHRALVRAFFGADSPIHGGLSPEQFDGLFAAQSRSDATMARHAADALDRSANGTMVVLAGTGHVLYGLGIARQLPDRYRTSAVTIVPVSIPIGSETSEASASVADFVWGVPALPYPSYPELGVITAQVPDGLHVIHVDPASPAGAAGIETGDVLTDVGGSAVAQKSDLARALAAANWGDVLEMGLSRDGQRREFAVPLRR
jgi:uncharacterized iron-regulated protein